jgi:hypothetical protein
MYLALVQPSQTSSRPNSRGEREHVELINLTRTSSLVDVGCLVGHTVVCGAVFYKPEAFRNRVGPVRWDYVEAGVFGRSSVVSVVSHPKGVKHSFDFPSTSALSGEDPIGRCGAA